MKKTNIDANVKNPDSEALKQFEHFLDNVKSIMSQSIENIIDHYSELDINNIELVLVVKNLEYAAIISTTDRTLELVIEASNYLKHNPDALDTVIQNMSRTKH